MATGNSDKITIAVGAGNAPVVIDWQENDTVATVLQRAQVKIGSDQTAVIGKRRVKNIERHKVRPGDTIVIAGKPANG